MGCSLKPFLFPTKLSSQCFLINKLGMITNISLGSPEDEVIIYRLFSNIFITTLMVDREKIGKAHKFIVEKNFIEVSLCLKSGYIFCLFFFFWSTIDLFALI